MARSSSPFVSDSGRPEHLINAEADKALSRIVISHFIAFAVLLLLMTVVMSYLNIPGTPLFPDRRFLDTISMLIVMTPFFLGTNKFFATRLRLGREFVANKQWKEAEASLEAFSHMGQRFLDRSGEAHYLLAVALDHLGKIAEAQKAREFVLKSRPTSSWAQRLIQAEQVRPRASRPPARRIEAAAKADNAAARPGAAKSEENRSRPAKSRRRRL